MPEPDAAAEECRRALSELFAYLDGEVDAGSEAEVAHHLDRCSDCLEAFEFHHELRRLVAKRCSRAAPDQLRARILAALAELDDRTG
jgi:mycothiol system anti-sigma-R factor